MKAFLASTLIAVFVSWAASAHAQATTSARLLNISTRTQVRQKDEQALIGGFIVTGSVPKRVILRALGPSLENSGLPRYLPDPTSELVNSSGVVAATNDDWFVQRLFR